MKCPLNIVDGVFQDCIGADCAHYLQLDRRTEGSDEVEKVGGCATSYTAILLIEQTHAMIRLNQRSTQSQGEQVIGDQGNADV